MRHVLKKKVWITRVWVLSDVLILKLFIYFILFYFLQGWWKGSRSSTKDQGCAMWSPRCVWRLVSPSCSPLVESASTDTSIFAIQIHTPGNWTIPENRENNKIEIQFFSRQRHALWRSFDIFVVTERVTNFCQNWSTCYYFLSKKLNFHFLFFPIFGYCRQLPVGHIAVASVAFGKGTGSQVSMIL